MGDWPNEMAPSDWAEQAREVAAAGTRTVRVSDVHENGYKPIGCARCHEKIRVGDRMFVVRGVDWVEYRHADECAQAPEGAAPARRLMDDVIDEIRRARS